MQHVNHRMFNPYLVLVQPRKAHPDITEKLLTRTLRNKSNKQTGGRVITKQLIVTSVWVCEQIHCMYDSIYQTLAICVMLVISLYGV